MQPGDTITPQSKPEDDTAKPDAARESDEAQKTPSTPPRTESTQEETAVADSREVASTQPTPWQYSAEDEVAANQLAPVNLPPVSWSASEFVEHEKNSSWFMGLAGLTLLVVVLIYLVTHDFITSVVIIMAAALFGVTAMRKPRTLPYQLDQIGVTIGSKSYPYDTFKSFSVLQEGAFNSIQLLPLRRFMPPISLYYPPENEERIITMLGSYLPHEERSHDAVDRLMRKIRF